MHVLRRTFNNLSRQVAGAIVTRAITGHVTEEMTEHYSHVDRAEKLRAADQVVALAGLRVTSANDVAATTTPNPTHPQVGDQVGDSTNERPRAALASPSPSPARREKGNGTRQCGREDLNFHTLAGTRT